MLWNAGQGLMLCSAVPLFSYTVNQFLLWSLRPASWCHSPFVVADLWVRIYLWQEVGRGSLHVRDEWRWCTHPPHWVFHLWLVMGVQYCLLEETAGWSCMMILERRSVWIWVQFYPWVPSIPVHTVHMHGNVRLHVYHLDACTSLNHLHFHNTHLQCVQLSSRVHKLILQLQTIKLPNGQKES